MNSLEKSLLSSLPENLQNECRIREIARQNHSTFAEAVSIVWLKYAEQKEKRIQNNDTDLLSGIIRSQKDPAVKLAQTYALTMKEAGCIINSELVRLGTATGDELYEAGCAFLREKTFNSARSQLRRETQAGSKNTFSLDESVGNLHDIITDNGEDADPLVWLTAAETVEEREQELLKNGTNFHNVDLEQSALEKTPAEIAKTLNVTLRRGQQIVKQMRHSATTRRNAVEGGVGQTELF
jgi:hypothetical protein